MRKEKLFNRPLIQEKYHKTARQMGDVMSEYSDEPIGPQYQAKERIA